MQVESSATQKPLPDYEMVEGIMCPFHPKEELRGFQDNFYYCPAVGCPVFVTDDNKHVVVQVLRQDTCPDIRSKWGLFYCDCGFKPGMRLSKTKENFSRVFLTCGNADKNNKCKFFLWTHKPEYRRTKQPPKESSDPRKEAQPWKRVQYKLKPTNKPYPVFGPMNHLGEEVDMPGDQAAMSIQRQRDRFDKEAQANMEARQKCGLMSYDRDTYVKYGSGIF